MGGPVILVVEGLVAVKRVEETSVDAGIRNLCISTVTCCMHQSISISIYICISVLIMGGR
jgi:hypothetical protein